MTQYFTNINSFSDLKSQYKALALANHPDRGGDTATMQAINAEYDRLYVIWVNREPEQVRPSATAEQSRREFYTAWGWEGSRYDRNLGTKDIAALVREYCKTHWNQWKFSVRCHFASMCSEIRIELKGGPIECGTTKTDECSRKYGVQTSYHYHDHDDRIDPMAEVVMKDVVEYCQSFNYTTKKARITAPQGESHPESTQVTEGVQVVVYSDRALAVVGNTKPIRGTLKGLGGRFWGGLIIDGVRRVGWVFSRNRYTEDSLRQALNIK